MLGSVITVETRRALGVAGWVERRSIIVTNCCRRKMAQTWLPLLVPLQATP